MNLSKKFYFCRFVALLYVQCKYANYQNKRGCSSRTVCSLLRITTRMMTSDLQLFGEHKIGCIDWSSKRTQTWTRNYSSTNC